MLNPVKINIRLFIFKDQSVPRSKHTILCYTNQSVNAV